MLAPGDAALRPFPWRAVRDPWAVLVSELMLQQTQAGRALAPWARFLRRFPEPAACAAAPTGAVVRAWAGLGYNRRAVQLHRAAMAMLERHQGTVPDRLEDLMALPGVGPYTARAVLVFAFERRVGVVDVNVARVLHRSAAGVRLTPVATQALADSLVPPGRSWSWNQALLDHGATCCTARHPRCGTCRLRRCCAWAVAGHPEPDPARRRRPQSPFEGSDRQGRGRLVSALRRGPLGAAELPVASGWPDDARRAERVAEGLVAEGLARRARDGSLRLT